MAATGCLGVANLSHNFNDVSGPLLEAEIDRDIKMLCSVKRIVQFVGSFKSSCFEAATLPGRRGGMDPRAEAGGDVDAKRHAGGGRAACGGWAAIQVL
jgi:hypothetical protein